jgi:PAS domain-containing protein
VKRTVTTEKASANIPVSGQTGVDQALIKSELRYRRLFESAQDGILILNAETGLIATKRTASVKLALETMKRLGQTSLVELLSPFSVLIQYDETGDTGVLDRLRGEERHIVEKMIAMLNGRSLEKENGGSKLERS